MVTYESNQQEHITDLLQKFDHSDIEFVIPRGHTSLPESVPGADIDILVQNSDLGRATSIAESLGFQQSSLLDTLKRTSDLAEQAIDDPRQALRKLRTEPVDILRMIVTGESESISLRNQYQQAKLSLDGVHIHLFNHLAYVSPYNGKKVRVDPAVERGMLRRRTYQGKIPVPSAADELVHLVCRGVFDKEGEFPDYYLERCDELWDSVRRDSRSKAILEHLLSMVFFDADSVAYDAIEEANYDDLREELKRFDEY